MHVQGQRATAQRCGLGFLYEPSYAGADTSRLRGRARLSGKRRTRWFISLAYGFRSFRCGGGRYQRSDQCHPKKNRLLVLADPDAFNAHEATLLFAKAASNS